MIYLSFCNNLKKDPSLCKNLTNNLKYSRLWIHFNFNPIHLLSKSLLMRNILIIIHS